MKYSQEVIKRAYDELDKRRAKAAAIQDAHVEDVRINYPEIFGIYSEIVSTKDRLAEVILSRGEDVRAGIEKIRRENLKNQKALKDALKRFSLPEKYLETQYFCPLCCDTGVREGNRCECVTELLDRYEVEALNEQCRIKLHSFAEFDLTYYPESFTYRGNVINSREKMADNLKFCMDYAKNFSESSPGLFMYGATGLGKTFLSGCIAKELLSRGYSVAFDSILNYLSDIEDRHFNKTDAEVPDTLQIILNADLAILDDLGSEYKTAFSSATMYNIINSRLNMGKPTVISSNLTMEQLAEKYDDRIISRIMGMFYTVRFFGEDIRQIKRRKGVFV